MPAAARRQPQCAPDYAVTRRPEQTHALPAREKTHAVRETACWCVRLPRTSGSLLVLFLFPSGSSTGDPARDYHSAEPADVSSLQSGAVLWTIASSEDELCLFVYLQGRMDCPIDKPGAIAAESVGGQGGGPLLALADVPPTATKVACPTPGHLALVSQSASADGLHAHLSGSRQTQHILTPRCVACPILVGLTVADPQCRTEQPVCPRGLPADGCVPAVCNRHAAPAWLCSACLKLSAVIYELLLRVTHSQTLLGHVII